MPLCCMARLSVVSPPSVAHQLKSKDSTVTATLGNFGHIQYGASFIGKVIYPYKTKHNVHGCKPFTWEDFGGQDQISSSFFVMVERGGNCNNPTKVKHAQDFGAQVLLIADSFEESINGLVMESHHMRGDIYSVGYMVDHDEAWQIINAIKQGT